MLNKKICSPKTDYETNNHLPCPMKKICSPVRKQTLINTFPFLHKYILHQTENKTNNFSFLRHSMVMWKIESHKKYYFEIRLSKKNAPTRMLTFSCFHPHKKILLHITLENLVNVKWNRIENTKLTPREYMFVNTINFLQNDHKNLIVFLSHEYPLIILQHWGILWISRETGMRTPNWHHVNKHLRTANYIYDKY